MCEFALKKQQHQPHYNRAHRERVENASNYITIGLIDVPRGHFFFPYSGQEFILLFRLTDREIVVYTDDYNYQYSFEYQFDFGDVKAVQVWHDVDSIEEVTFRYNKKSMN